MRPEPETTAVAEDAGPPRARPAALLMQPERLAALQPCRISASRALVNQVIRERWSIRRLRFAIDDAARGTALYRIDAGGQIFDFVVFSFAFSPDGRTGRIIGRSWDMMAALIEGPVSDADIETTRQEMPKLYAGRATPGTLVWCRSNRSSRAFDHAVESLAMGRQPDVATLARVCYVMRNTGLDGNGTFGTRSFYALEPSHRLRRALSAQMLCAYMMRCFAQDIVEHLARCRSARAVALAPEIARFLGVGNGSALGLVLFVNNHPRLIDRWLGAREDALAHAKALHPTPEALWHLVRLLDRAILFRRQDRMHYEALTASAEVARDLEHLRNAAQALMHQEAAGGIPGRYPLARLAAQAQATVGAEAEETLNALLLELVPETADALAADLGVFEDMATAPAMRVAMLREIVRSEYAWALRTDLSAPGAARYIWYKSESAEEPRRGPPEEVTGAINLGLDLPREIQALDTALSAADPQQDSATFLLHRPALRAAVARVQSLHGLRYHSPHMNMMGENFVPIHIVRMMNVALHGIDKTRDFLNRNLRGVLFHGAPLPGELAAGADADWYYPPEPAA